MWRVIACIAKGRWTSSTRGQLVELQWSEAERVAVVADPPQASLLLGFRDHDWTRGPAVRPVRPSQPDPDIPRADAVLCPRGPSHSSNDAAAGPGSRWSRRDAPVGWIAAAAVYLVWTWVVVSRMDEQRTASHATREDPTRVATDVIVLAASVASLAGVAYLLVGGSAKSVQAAVSICVGNEGNFRANGCGKAQLLATKQMADATSSGRPGRPSGIFVANSAWSVPATSHASTTRSNFCSASSATLVRRQVGH